MSDEEAHARSSMIFRLRFPIPAIPEWASRYSYGDDDVVANLIAPRARQRGHLTRSEFLTICEWKTKRSKSRCAKNSDGRVREATGIALSTTDDRAKIGVLRLLDGVDWPTASVILHFCDQLPYPILDFRALWSLGFAKPPTYNYEFWKGYTAFTRELSRETGYSMREIDRALWQYSKERQRRT